jgi:hypothetical protein
MPRPHEDGAHRSHSDHPEGAMGAAVQHLQAKGVCLIVCLCLCLCLCVCRSIAPAATLRVPPAVCALGALHIYTCTLLTVHTHTNTRNTQMGAKIQCSSCYTAYHPLCARMAGLHMEQIDPPAGAVDAAMQIVSLCPKHCRPQPHLSGTEW